MNTVLRMLQYACNRALYFRKIEGCTVGYSVIWFHCTSFCIERNNGWYILVICNQYCKNYPYEKKENVMLRI